MLELYNAFECQLKLKQWKFPAGEVGVKIEDDIKNDDFFIVKLIYESSDDLIFLGLLVDAIREIKKDAEIALICPYLPYARQDRACSEGESFSLRFIANYINSLNFSQVTTYDVHSKVSEELITNIFNVHQASLVFDLVKDKENYALVSPDKGASKKIFNLAQALGLEVFEASKVRSTIDGKIIATEIDGSNFYKYNELVVVDDICDGGMTFLELAKVIRKTFNGKLTLVVTHGILSKGFSELEKYFDEIKYVVNLQKEKK